MVKKKVSPRQTYSSPFKTKSASTSQLTSPDIPDNSSLSSDVSCIGSCSLVVKENKGIRKNVCGVRYSFSLDLK